MVTSDVYRSFIPIKLHLYEELSYSVDFKTLQDQDQANIHSFRAWQIVLIFNYAI